jgi:hypothetical protein
VPTAPYGPPLVDVSLAPVPIGKRSKFMRIIFAAGLLAIASLGALASFAYGVKYHQSRSDEALNALGTNAISSLKRQGTFIRLCDTGRLMCDENVQHQMWSNYATSLLDVWIYYTISKDESAADGICDSLKSVRPRDGSVHEAQALTSSRLDCSYREPKSVPKPRVTPETRSTAMEDSGLSANLTNEQKVEEIRRKIERRRTQMRAKLDQARDRK